MTITNRWNDEIERLVAEADRHWQVQRLPRDERRAMREELRDHLEGARAAGRPLRDVVGDDPVALAARWAKAAGGPDALELLLRWCALGLVTAAVLTVVVTLANGAQPSGLDAGSVVMLGAVMFGSVVRDLVMLQRDRLQPAHVAAATFACALVAGIVAGAAADRSIEGMVVAIPLPTAVALLAVGLTAELVRARRRRARALRR